MKVWITRARAAAAGDAEQGAAATAQRLAAAGHTPLIAPLLEARATPARLERDGVAALALTSAQALAFADLGPEWRDLPVYAVGQATAAAARQAGFAQVVSAEGDVEALAEVIARDAPFEGAVLHLSAAEPAGDLAGALTRAGVSARAAVVYETILPELDSATLSEAFACEAVLLHSPRAARAFAQLAEGRPLGRMTACCLSANVAAPVHGLGLDAVKVAAAPSEAALLALLDSAGPTPSAGPAPGADDDGKPPRGVMTPLFWAMMLLSAASMAAAVLVSTALVRHPH